MWCQWTIWLSTFVVSRATVNLALNTWTSAIHWRCWWYTTLGMVESNLAGSYMTKSCLVAVCCNQPAIFTKTTQSLMELGWGDRIPYTKNKYGFDRIELAWYTGAPRVDMLRNQAAKDAIKRDYTHLIFLDADMVWPTTVLHDLLAHHAQGIVAGLYVLKGPPYSPVHLVDQFEEDGVQMFHRATEFDKDLVPVDVVGMGCTLIPVHVLREIGDANWFEYDTDKEGWPRVSEDVTFCLKAKALGHQSYMDPTIKCGHVATQVVDHRFHTRYQASIEQSKKEGPIVMLQEKPDEVPA